MALRQGRQVKLLFIADPFHKINPRLDTTLLLVFQAWRRRHNVFWATSGDLRLFESRVQVTGSPVKSCMPNGLPEVGKPRPHYLSSMDAVLIRKDPPFDSDYVRLCWFLALEESKVWMMNRPSVLLTHQEKLIPLEAVAKGYLKESEVVPTFLGCVEEARQAFLRKQLKTVVAKPLLGCAGQGVRSVKTSTLLSSGIKTDEMLQPFQKAVTKTGNLSAYFLGGEYFAHFVKVPKKGDFLSNILRGGHGESRPLFHEEQTVLTKIGKFLKDERIHYAGVDMLGSKICEVNITSPGGLTDLWDLESKDHSEQVMNFVENSAAQYKK